MPKTSGGWERVKNKLFKNLIANLNFRPKRALIPKISKKNIHY